jgi:hypothetical protein
VDDDAEASDPGAAGPRADVPKSFRAVWFVDRVVTEQQAASPYRDGIFHASLLQNRVS